MTCLLAASLALAQAPDAAPLREQGVAAARAGRHDTGIALLLQARAAAPDDKGILADLVVVLSWAGRDRMALARFTELGEDAAPGYALAAAAVSARRMGRATLAVHLYRLALERGTEDRDLRQGIAMAEIDRGRRQAAREVLQEILVQHPDDARAAALLRELNRPPPIDVPAVAARIRQMAANGQDDGATRFADDAARQASPASVAELADALLEMRRPYDALLILTRALRTAPQDLALRRQEIMALERIGAAGLARSRAEAYPDAVRSAEQRRLLGGAAAFDIRWGDQVQDPAERLPERRFARTDRAIAMLDTAIATWDAQGEAAAPQRRNARLDRVVAFANRGRMAEAVAEGEALAAEGRLPPYVLVSLARAYFALRRAGEAERSFRAALAADPGLTDARFGLFYVLTEQRKWPEARLVVEELDRMIPTWRPVRGPAPQSAPLYAEEWDRISVERLAAFWHQFGDDLAEAERRVDAMARAAPRNTALRAHRGDIWRARLWPQQALDEYDAALSDTPDALELRLGRGNALLDLRRYREAAAQAQELAEVYPEEPGVTRLSRRLDLWRMWELEAETTAGLSRGSPDGEFDVSLRLYSPPIDWNWRLFAGTGLRSASTANGALTTIRLSTGAEWRDQHLVLRAGVSADIKGRDRAGGFIEGSWRLSDRITLSSTVEATARDTPLAALRAGIWADAVSLGVVWRADDLREVEATGRAMRFSDDNTRLIGYLRARQRVWNHPDWKLDLEPYAYATSNTRDGAPYFNPERDVEVALSATLTWIVSGQWARSFRVSASLTGGGYWQQGFGWSPLIAARVENTHAISDALQLSYGVGWTRRSYDGAGEDGFFGIAALRWRF